MNHIYLGFKSTLAFVDSIIRIDLKHYSNEVKLGNLQGIPAIGISLCTPQIESLVSILNMSSKTPDLFSEIRSDNSIYDLISSIYNNFHLFLTENPSFLERDYMRTHYAHAAILYLMSGCIYKKELSNDDLFKSSFLIGRGTYNTGLFTLSEHMPLELFNSLRLCILNVHLDRMLSDGKVLSKYYEPSSSEHKMFVGLLTNLNTRIFSDSDTLFKLNILLMSIPEESKSVHFVSRICANKCSDFHNFEYVNGFDYAGLKKAAANELKCANPTLYKKFDFLVGLGNSWTDVLKAHTLNSDKYETLPELTHDYFQTFSG